MAHPEIKNPVVETSVEIDPRPPGLVRLAIFQFRTGRVLYLQRQLRRSLADDEYLKQRTTCYATKDRLFHYSQLHPTLPDDSVLSMNPAHKHPLRSVNKYRYTP